MKTLLFAICLAFAVPTFASTNTVKKQTVFEIGDNPVPPAPQQPKQ